MGRQQRQNDLRAVWSQVNKTIRSDDPDFNDSILERLEAIPPRDRRGRSMKRRSTDGRNSLN
jgi:hypothetical protein